MNAETWGSIGASLAAAGAAVWTARAAKRTPRQEKRDDFVAITTQQGAAIERLEKRVQLREAEAEKQRQRISDQDEAIGWLISRVRGLVLHIRRAGLEPPAAEPMSERARQYIHHIDA